jgi:hypothetical protein
MTLTCVFVFSLAAGHGMIDQLEDAIRYVGSLPNRKYQCFGSSRSRSDPGVESINSINMMVLQSWLISTYLAKPEA